MIGLDVIQKDMQSLLEADKSLNAIEVNADSLDEALADAATNLTPAWRTLSMKFWRREATAF